MIDTAGTWDRDAWPRYFLAGPLDHVVTASQFADDLLISILELYTDEHMVALESLLDAGKSILLDSGVYTLASKHAEHHSMTMDDALSLPPHRIDGYDDLMARYVDVCRRYGDRLWGYVEIDQGGADNKRLTREKLHDAGLNPIPVYHPFNDGWDYFDELAKGYDRMCFGNVVNADSETRKRLVATACHRQRDYPDLWIHMLGLTPSELTVSFPMQSCDSSTWEWPFRWGRFPQWSMTQPIDWTEKDFVYDKEHGRDGDKGYLKCIQLAAYDAFMMGRTMRRMRQDREAAGL
jgi:hypothetical protein